MHVLGCKICPSTFKMASGGKKKAKPKGKTLALNEFLQNEDGSVPAPVSTSSSSWASQMENVEFDDGEDSLPTFDRSKLPTAPKAARGPDIDLDRIPDRPPFTAFVGNLPYDASEDKIATFFEGRNLEVENVRLPSDNGRQRGFGYVEFRSKEALISALTLNEEMFSGRKLRVDLSESTGGDRERGDNRSDRNDWRGGGDPDRTEGDWRRRDPPAFNDDRGGYNDRGGDRYGDRARDRGYSGGGGGYGDRGGDRFGDRDRRGYGDRGGDRYGGYSDRGNRYGDRDSGRYGDRTGGRYGDRDRYSEERGGFSDRNDDRYGGDRRSGGGYDDRRSGYDDRRGGYDDRRGGYDDRRGGGYDDRRGGRYDDRRGGGDRYGGDRYGGRSSYDDRGYGSRREGGYRRDDDGGRPSYREDRGDRGGSREGSQDAPRERPRLNLQPRTKPVNSTPAAPERNSSIFGGAKPVDTAAKERAIEEKLKRLDTNVHYASEENYSRDGGYRDSRDGGRPRRDSDRSDGSRGGGGRERRPSNSSSKTGGNRRDSEVSRTSDDSHPPEGETKMVPAPIPKENAWAKPRSEAITRPAEQPARQLSSGSQDGRDYYESDRRDNRRSSDDGRRGGYGRGYSSGRPDGRRNERPEEHSSQKRREKQLPKSVDDMPRLEQGPGKNWADANKFAAFMDDEDGND